MTDNITEALAYVDKSLDNVADLDPDTAWTNVEVVEVLEDPRALLVTGEITPGTFEQAHTPTDDEREALATILGEPVRGTLVLADRILAAGFRRTVQAERPSFDAFGEPRNRAAQELQAQGDLSDDEREAWLAGERSFADAMHYVANPDDEREALEGWSFEHRPILSMRDGSIASCKCMDRVFINGREDWDQHIADSLVTAGFRRTVQSDHYDEGTLVKVYDALQSVLPDISEWVIRDQVNAMQNAGILFRERTVQGEPWEPCAALCGDRPCSPACERRVQGEPADAPTVQLMARKGGKPQALIDRMLVQANEHGIRVEVVYPQGEPTDAAKRAVAIAVFEGYVTHDGGRFGWPAYAYDREKAEYVAERALRAAAATQEGENRD